MEDVQLARLAAEGDQSAFEQLVVRYQKPIYNLALRMAGNEQDALDLAQEAFLRAWRGLPFFKFESSFSTWIYRLTSNVCIDFLRRKKREGTVAMHFVDDEDKEQEFAQPDPAPGPEDLAIRSDERMRIEQALSELEPEYREALTLCAIQGLSYIEIAEVLEIPAGTVKSRISRAREKMRRKLLGTGNKDAPPSSTHTGKEASAT